MTYSNAQTMPSAPETIGGRITLLHLIVVSMSLAMTALAWNISKTQIETRIQTRIETRFEASRDRVLGLITERMNKSEGALWAGVSAIKSHGEEISQDQWHSFASTLQAENRYPGISGIGLIHSLNDQTLPAYLKQRRAERPQFDIYPAHGKNMYLPISFIAAEGPNADIVGWDVANDLSRRRPVLASRDTGTVQISAPFVPAQGNTPGFWLYAPVYRGGPATTLAARRDRFLGVVYAPFILRDLMEGLLAKDLRGVRFSIRDGDQLIYDEHSLDDPLYDPAPLFADQAELDLYGRTWVFDVRSNLAFRDENTYAQPTVILLAGLIIEALIIALLILISRTNARAVAYADKVTVALRQKTDRLAQTNEDLEQFAYITSHDLKTPIRGIGGLTEMLQEDLEGYLNSSDANPEVALNLNRILDRVHRMNALTRGVLEFARIDPPQAGEAPLVLKEAIAALTSDFGLGPDQLILTGDVQAVQYDTFNLRRILENLVGNAVKYHDGAEDIQISVTAQTSGGWCRISVQDNGPGIEPRFHTRIFDVFQTLRTGDAPESTGIGLAIVKKSVEGHGGKITLNSTLGHGATFRFDWPLTADTNAQRDTGKAA